MFLAGVQTTTKECLIAIVLQPQQPPMFDSGSLMALYVLDNFSGQDSQKPNISIHDYANTLADVSLEQIYCCKVRIWSTEMLKMLEF